MSNIYLKRNSSGRFDLVSESLNMEFSTREEAQRSFPNSNVYILKEKKGWESGWPIHP